MLLTCGGEKCTQQKCSYLLICTHMLTFNNKDSVSLCISTKMYPRSTKGVCLWQFRVTKLEPCKKQNYLRKSFKSVGLPFLMASLSN